MTDHAKELEALLTINWNDRVSKVIADAAAHIRHLNAQLQREQSMVSLLESANKRMLEALENPE